MFEDAFKNSAMKGYITICAKVQSVRRKNLCDVGGYFIRLLFLIIIRLTTCLRLIIGLDEFTYLVNTYLALNMFLGRLLQIV